MTQQVQCAIVRGGTSKAVFLRAADLPAPGPARDRMIKAIMGTPDRRQIDGLGGADILTSKVAILGPPTHPDADVDYTFAQVGIAEDVVSYDGSCGNIATAVGAMAIVFGWVDAGEGEHRTVRIHDVNSGGIIVNEVPIAAGEPQSRGSFRIDGVPCGGAPVRVDMAGMIGSQTGELLPWGAGKIPLEVPGLGTLAVSLVDLANPVVFVFAEQLGLSGCESAEQLQADPERIELFETIRSVAAQRLGFVEDYRRGFAESPYIPFFCFLGPSHSYTTVAGTRVSERECDLVARLVGFKRTHRAFPGTGAACLAVASRLPQTVPYDLLTRRALQQPVLRIGHPSGVLPVEVAVSPDGVPTRAAYASTWRRIMQGEVFINLESDSADRPVQLSTTTGEE